MTNVPDDFAPILVQNIQNVFVEVSIPTDPDQLRRLAGLAIDIYKREGDDDSLKERLEHQFDIGIFSRRIHGTTLERYSDVVMATFQKHGLIECPEYWDYTESWWETELV